MASPAGARRRYVQTLDPTDLDEVETFVVDLMEALFVAVESDGGRCFDVLVREAIERGERRLAVALK